MSASRFVTFERVCGRPYRGPMEEHIDTHLSYEPDLSPTLDPTMALENSAYVLRSRVIGRESQPNFHTGDDNGATHQGAHDEQMARAQLASTSSVCNILPHVDAGTSASTSTQPEQEPPLEAGATDWAAVRAQTILATRTHLWPRGAAYPKAHRYLDASPFPRSFNESAVIAHGSMAVAAQAGLLTRDEVLGAYRTMQADVADAKVTPSPHPSPEPDLDHGPRRSHSQRPGSPRVRCSVRAAAHPAPLRRAAGPRPLRRGGAGSSRRRRGAVASTPRGLVALIPWSSRVDAAGRSRRRRGGWSL